MKLTWPVLLLILAPAAAQLRPRRVGIDPMGEMAGGGGGDDIEAKLAKLAELGLANGDMAGDPQAQMAALQAAMAESGMGGDAMAEVMRKGMAEAGEAMAEMMQNPDLLQQRMADLMTASDGEGKNVLEEMTSVLTDPNKLRDGMAQMANNPMFAQMAAAMPGLGDALNDPAMVEASIMQVTQAFAAMQVRPGRTAYYIYIYRERARGYGKVVL